MKIVNRQQFLALPPNTLFSKFEPCNFGDIEIKGETVVSVDYYAQPIADAVAYDDSADFARILFEARDHGTSIPLDFDCETRDGYFDQDQLFAVWEPHDITQLITRLQKCLPAPKEDPFDLLMSFIRRMDERAVQYRKEAEENDDSETAGQNFRVHCVLQELHRLGTELKAR